MDNGATCFNYMDNGVIINSTSSYKEGFGIINGELKYGIIGTERFEDFVSGYPVLIKAGKKIQITYAKELDYKARRTVLAYNKSNIYLIAIEKPGMAFTEM